MNAGLRSKVVLMVLAVLSLIPTFAAATLQFLAVGYGTTIGAQVAVSDASGWQSCASSFVAGQASMQMDWCLRRPLAIPVLGVIHALAPLSASSVLLIQMVLLGLASFLLALASVRVLHLNAISAAAVIVLLWWPSLTYGLSHGPEAAALTLAITALVTLLMYFSSRRLPWALASGFSMLTALAIRPGNLLLTAVFLAVILLFLQRYTQKAWITVVVASMFVVFWLTPNRLFRILGFDEAGHGANFWFTIYSAATPESDDYNVVYSVFAAEAQRFGTESRAFGETVRDASLDLIRSDPLPLLQQAGTNLNSLWERDLITRTLAVPGNSNLAFLDPMDFFHDPTWSRSIEAFSALLWIASAVFVIAAIASLFVLTARLKAALSTQFNGRNLVEYRIAAISLALAAIVGAVGFYALVGHDEGERHLVQNAPFLVTGLLLSIDTILQYLQGSKEPLPVNAPAVKRPVTFIMTMFTLLVLALALEGRQSTSSILVRDSCQQSDWGIQLATPISVASNGSGVQLKTPTSWRGRGDKRFQTLARQSNWIAPLAEELPNGFFTTLRFSDGDTRLTYIDTSEVIPSTLSEVVEVCFEPVSPESPLVDLGLDRIGYLVVRE